MSASSGLADPVQFAASDPLSAPDWLSPEGIHEYLLRAHRISNELRFKFIEALRALDEGRFFHSLGFPTMWAYAEHFFGWERSRTYDALRVARTLDDLPWTPTASSEASPTRGSSRSRASPPARPRRSGSSSPGRRP